MDVSYRGRRYMKKCVGHYVSNKHYREPLSRSLDGGVLVNEIHRAIELSSYLC